jgi:hypothetical protein
MAAAQVGQTVGPDIIVGDFPDLSNNNPAAVNGVMYDSFAVGTTSCNRGNTPVNWFTGGTENRHPAISQNLFRYSSTTGQFEQMGQGSLKHGFTALQGTTCSAYFGFGCSATAGTTLGVGCSDPYCCGLNNSPGGMGPKWQVNAAAGLFPYPYPSNPSSGPIRVRLADLNAAGITGNRFFVEAQYICGDDAARGNKNNNASWREVTMTATGVPPAATNFTLASFAAGSAMHREQAGVYAWQAVDPSVTITTLDVPGDGQFVLASKVSGTGPYVYEYALQNLNSHRCAGSFTVPLPGSQADLANVGFHDVEAVGEPNALAAGADPASNDWTVSGGLAGSNAVAWSGPTYNGRPPTYNMTTTPYRVASFVAGTSNDHSANVLRWGTMFNFRFTSNVAPGNGTIAIGLWRPGTEPLVTIAGPTPGGATIPTGSCCTAGVCNTTVQPSCTGAWTAGAACTPNPCPPIGACCNGAACSITLQVGCGGAWAGGGSTCGTPGNPTTCCPVNINHTAGVSVQDVFDFLGGYFGNDIAVADFNHSGEVSTQDIFDFVEAYFVGCTATN